MSTDLNVQWSLHDGNYYFLTNQFPNMIYRLDPRTGQRLTKVWKRLDAPNFLPELSTAHNCVINNQSFAYTVANQHWHTAGQPAPFTSRIIHLLNQIEHLPFDNFSPTDLPTDSPSYLIQYTVPQEPQNTVRIWFDDGHENEITDAPKKIHQAL